MALLTFFTIVAAVLIGACIYLFLKLKPRLNPQPHDTEWLDLFSLDKYAPMERLLDKGDFAFLAAQPGYRPQIGKRLLAERRRLLVGYLKLVLRDFAQLHRIARIMLVYSPTDRPEFAQALWRQQVKFYFAVCVIRCKITLYPWGWTAVDVPKLLHEVEQMCGQVRKLAALPAAGDATV